MSNQQYDLPPLPPSEIETLSDLACLKDLKLSMEFIQALDKASLDHEYSGLDLDTTGCLWNPPTPCPDTSDPDFRLGLDLFLTSIKSLQDTYNMSHDAVLHRHPDDKKMHKITTELQNNHGSLFQFTNFLHGSAYLNAVQMGRIKDTNMVLMLSIDGAQLFKHKASDVWIYIWVVFDLAPDLWYKKKYVLPGLHHLAALQHKGLQIWDALEDIVFTLNPFLALATADGPGMAYLNGLVGHHGKYGCHLYCSVTGWHKPGGSQYYPALLKPNNYAVQGCNHNNISFVNLLSCSQKDYFLNLRYLMSSPNETQYKKRRLETGISKPTIFLGLQQGQILGIPGCFGFDIMHLGSLNLLDLLINLWCGTLDCDKKDNISTWEWVTL
ncbi:hypothetical protein BYT27DRAFT_7255257 [Phlegmacium glaucopus]|nr:hypothetical protein BYT27DRAFT_7255257 [Phlegmacium glaucopus]